MTDILDFLTGKTVQRGTQSLIGHREIFRGIIVKDWYGANDARTSYHDIKKVIVFHSVKYYAHLWRSINLRRNSDSILRERLLQWAEKETISVQNQANVNVSRYLETFDDIKRGSTDSIKTWLINLHTFKKNAVSTKSNDIRSFFTPRG